MAVERDARGSSKGGGKGSSSGGGAEQRAHLRYDRELSVRISRRGADKKHVNFSASVGTKDISIGGVFLESTFFLKQGLEIDLEIDLPSSGSKKSPARTVKVRGEVARVIDETRDHPSGFAIRFTGFEGRSEIDLRAFLGQADMFAFVEDVAPQLFAQLPADERWRLVELLVRWEIHREKTSDR